MLWSPIGTMSTFSQKRANVFIETLQAFSPILCGSAPKVKGLSYYFSADACLKDGRRGIRYHLEAVKRVPGIGPRRPVMKIQEVARRARVSTATISRTINNPSLVDPKTAKRVWKVIEKLRYYPDTQARAPVSGRSRILGLIVSDITNPFFPELIKGFEDVAIQNGYEILVSSTNYDSARMALCVRRMLERKVEGVAIMTSEMDKNLWISLPTGMCPWCFSTQALPAKASAKLWSITLWE